MSGLEANLRSPHSEFRREASKVYSPQFKLSNIFPPSQQDSPRIWASEVARMLGVRKHKWPVVTGACTALHSARATGNQPIGALSFLSLVMGGVVCVDEREKEK